MSEYSDLGARIAVLEHRMSNSEQKMTALDIKIDKKFEDIDKKLDALLELRAKGMGAFWLASILVGTGIFGLVTTLISWMKG